jgi:hypothetical protein
MENKAETRNSGINRLAFGSLISGWGILLVLQQAGIIDGNLSTWPFAFTAFGTLLIVLGIIKLNRSKHAEIE